MMIMKRQVAKDREAFAPAAVGVRRSIDSFTALMYHNIWADYRPYGELSPASTAYFVGRTAFAQQMQELDEVGASCMRWEDLVAFYGYGFDGRGHVAQADRYPVLLTFDDGWSGAVEIGGPILAHHQRQAVIFITGDLLDRPHFLSRSAVSKLDRRTFVVGSHSNTHCMLSLLDERSIRSELSDSKRLLEDLMGYEIDSLSVPNGAVDDRVRRIASECGYRYVFDSEIRVNRSIGDPLAIGRIPIRLNTPLEAVRRYARQRVVREWARHQVLSAGRQILGLTRYDRWRRRLLGE